jgi:hypothetical protein
MRSRITTAAVLLVAGTAGGLAIGLFGPVLHVMLDPNIPPAAGLQRYEIQAQVGEHVVLNASPSAVPGRPRARLRFEWFDADGDFRLLPASVDPESEQAKQIDVYGAVPGDRRITLRVTNMSRCHVFTNLGLSPERCERKDEQVAHITFDGEAKPPAENPQDCPPGRGLPADKLILDGPREIGPEDRGADCRLALPALIVTNGHVLRIRDGKATVAAAGDGTRIVAFQGALPRAAAGAFGTRGSSGQTGSSGGPGEQGRPGGNAGAVEIEASKISGTLTIDNSGQTGGQGGSGGPGGNGGIGAAGTSSVVRGPTCPVEAKNGQRGGNGGNGGPGGPGGSGGNGGDVRIRLAQPVAGPDRLIVRTGGGNGGPGGTGGYLGFPGDGGIAGRSDAPCPVPQPGEKGQPGLIGQTGTLGSRGVPGIFELKAGSATIREAGPLRQDEEVKIP